MKNSLGQRTPTETIIHRLRLMADSGGMLSRDRIKTIIEAADRLQEQVDNLACMVRAGGHADEEH